LHLTNISRLIIVLICIQETTVVSTDMKVSKTLNFTPYYWVGV